MEPQAEAKGILAVITGDGKGKTTSAIGTAVRALGYGHKVIMIQFIKGDWHYGEIDGIERLAPDFVLERAGLGFYKIMGDDRPEEAHKQAALKGLMRAQEVITSGEYQLVILDEINNAVKEGLLTIEQVLEVVDKKPPLLHLILTGRYAHPRLMEKADLVSEVREIKHPYKKGILAQRGFDF
ncbi:MAG TPA: cob(I)yrinic acid a,c-diamide adenosyltransferase [Acidobacteriota bacterium]|nr:cob(I)yrinic acid a,c-diamide adenosyltransferase [Acidobacteriota bacterium]